MATFSRSDDLRGAEFVGVDLCGARFVGADLSDAGTEGDGLDPSIFTTVAPSYAEVLEVRAGRVAMVRDFLATVTSDVLASTRSSPHAPDCHETVLSCLHGRPVQVVVVSTRSSRSTTFVQAQRAESR